MEKRNGVKGSCLCGAVTFTADGVDSGYHACHCDMCRRWNGGPNFGLMTESVRFEGEDNIQRFDSSEIAQRAFCKICGTHLFYYFKPMEMYVLSPGQFDDESAFKLIGEIYIDTQPDGYQFAGKHTRLTEEQFLAKFAPPS